MKKIIWVLSFCAVLTLAGCGTNTATNPSTTANANSISIENYAFNPATLTVKVGTTVTWTNNDSAVHQIQSGDFNSKMLSKGQTFSFTFNQAGNFDYACSIHPTMTGSIIVQ